MRRAPSFVLVMGLLLALAAGQLLLPAREMSEMENRVLAQAPQPSLQSVWDGSFMEALDEYAADQLPLREGFVSLYASMQFALGRRAVGDALLGENGLMFDFSDGWNERYVRMNAQALGALGERTGKRALLLAVPSAAVVDSDALPAHAPMPDEEAMLQAAAQQVQVLPLLERLRDAPPVLQHYRTDHHWTLDGVLMGYETVCQALGLEMQTQWTIERREGFYGSFYARYPLPWQRGDTLVWAQADGVRLLINGEEKPALADEEKLAGRDKYAALLHGNHAVIELLNDGAPEGTLLVVKDSYANALLPMLAAHYRRIVAIDPRYYAGDPVALFSDCEGDTILCVYGMNTLATGRSIALLEGL